MQDLRTTYQFTMSGIDDHEYCSQSQLTFDQTVYNAKDIEFESNQDEDELLISLVQSHPHLYNKELKDFRDATMKENSWQEIADVLNTDVGTCQKRWLRLRERYSREKKIQEIEISTVSAASKRKLFIFYENMKFLDRFVKRRKTLTNIRPYFKTEPLSATQKTAKTNCNVSSKINSSSGSTHFITLCPTSSSGNSAQLPTSSTTSIQQQSSGIPDFNSSSTSTPSPANFETSWSTESDINTDSGVNIESMSRRNSQTDTDNDSLMNRSIVKQRSSLETPIETDYLQTAITKMTSVMENIFSNKTSSSSLNQEIPEDIAFCQLILSKFAKMSEVEKAEVKKNILRIMFDL